MHLAVIGAGSWGTALALALAERFCSVRIWTRDPAFADAVGQAGENQRYLPGFRFPPSLTVSSDLGSVVSDAHVILLAVPSSHLRSVLRVLTNHVRADTIFVSATKGIEEGSLSRMSQVIREVVEQHSPMQLAVLSGPTFAREVAAGEPAAVAIAAEDLGLAETVQQAFSTASLRLYATTDVVGVEIGAALKNVIAIGAGVCRGLGLGSNSVAALVTRGLAEITRIAVDLGGSARTMSGLAGLGDLVLTATGDLSRNRYVGVQLGEGRKLQDILAGMTMVAEGVGTCRAAHQIGLQRNLDLPIVNKMYELLYEAKSPRIAIRELMQRPLTVE